MENKKPQSGWLQVVQVAGFFLGGILAIPLAIGISAGSTLHVTLGFIGSILILQPVATAAGILLGIPPVPVLLIMLSIGISVIFIFFGICDLFAEKSAWLRSQLDKVDAIAQRSALFQKYGIITLIPFIWVPGVGLYGCVLLSWIFGWRDLKGISIILAGWMLAVFIVLGASLGAMEIVT
ncbi:MAG: hypothetical protein CVV32_07985 [Methanomicrobiales archaeon HGW-Methanomicrobiales-3]|jgi:uncharacterized membrane protein|nr:MAG: hypothetical protein CVV32_07985 [Methanomicrobiales archaeon HGW-Methanomicrobiales-3]